MIFVAANMAKEAHQGQTDRAGEDYFLAHIIPVAFRALELSNGEHEENALMSAALLHDAIEDTNLTQEDIADALGPRIAAVVAIVSRTDGETYQEFIDRIRDSGDPMAILVKRADILDHLENGNEIPESLRKRYELAQEKLCISST